jgi:putative ABC transport system permease protein
LGGLIRGALYGLSTTDAPSFGRTLTMVAGVDVAASLVPAWRASRTDPLRALRHQ